MSTEICMSFACVCGVCVCAHMCIHLRCFCAWLYLCDCITVNHLTLMYLCGGISHYHWAGMTEDGWLTSLGGQACQHNEGYEASSGFVWEHESWWEGQRWERNHKALSSLEERERRGLPDCHSIADREHRVNFNCQPLRDKPHISTRNVIESEKERLRRLFLADLHTTEQIIQKDKSWGGRQMRNAGGSIRSNCLDQNLHNAWVDQKKKKMGTELITTTLPSVAMGKK